ncbi:MAG: hypothetical protein Q7U51_14780 [Methanoregula sp.]|nr:hypothetical protein [Methanoregula sp.]
MFWTVKNDRPVFSYSVVTAAQPAGTAGTTRRQKDRASRFDGDSGVFGKLDLLMTDTGRFFLFFFK